MSSNYQIKFDSFSDALCKALEIRDLSITELSNLIDKDTAQVSRYVNGVNVPHAKIRKLIAQTLMFDIQESDGIWTLSDLNLNEPKVPYADQVVFPQNGKLSQDELRQLIEQIELLLKIVKGSLK